MGNLTRDLPAPSAVPQATATPPNSKTACSASTVGRRISPTIAETRRHFHRKLGLNLIISIPLCTRNKFIALYRLYTTYK